MMTVLYPSDLGKCINLKPSALVLWSFGNYALDKLHLVGLFVAR